MILDVGYNSISEGVIMEQPTQNNFDSFGTQYTIVIYIHTYTHVHLQNTYKYTHINTLMYIHNYTFANTLLTTFFFV